MSPLGVLKRIFFRVNVHYCCITATLLLILGVWYTPFCGITKSRIHASGWFLQPGIQAPALIFCPCIQLYIYIYIKRIGVGGCMTIVWKQCPPPPTHWKIFHELGWDFKADVAPKILHFHIIASISEKIWYHWTSGPSFFCPWKV